MRYDMTSPCSECPFRKDMAHGFSLKKLAGFASGEFPCHKTADTTEGDNGQSVFTAAPESQHCAGALIFNEKRNRPHQMARICERLGLFDPSQLNMEADVR